LKKLKKKKVIIKGKVFAALTKGEVQILQVLKSDVKKRTNDGGWLPVRT
jgi:hypothetical protein